MPKTKKQVKRQAPRGRQPIPRGMPRAATKAAHAVCGLTDPFCQHAVAVQYPDDSSARTITEQLRLDIPVAADSYGNGAIGFAPSITNPYILPSSQLESGNVVWGSWSSNPQSSLFSTYGGNYRVVSYGIRVMNTASATNASGFLIAGTKEYLGNGDVIAFTPSALDNATTQSLTHGFEMVLLPKPYGPTARLFDSATATAQKWDNMVVMWTGAPEGAVLVFEIVMNYEFILKSDGTTDNIGTLAKPSPNPAPTLTKVATTVGSSIGNFFIGTLERFSSKVAGLAAGAVMSRIAGPTAGASAYHMIADVVD